MALPAEDIAPRFTIPELLRKARKEAGIRSYAHMAMLLSDHFGHEIKPSTVGAWERGDNQPTKGGVNLVAVVNAYAQICGKPPSWFWSASGYKCDDAGRPLLGLIQGTLDRPRQDPLPFGGRQLTSVGS